MKTPMGVSVLHSALSDPIHPAETDPETMFGHVLEWAKKGEWNAVCFPGESDWETCHPFEGRHYFSDLRSGWGWGSLNTMY